MSQTKNSIIFSVSQKSKLFKEIENFFSIVIANTFFFYFVVLFFIVKHLCYIDFFQYNDKEIIEKIFIKKYLQKIIFFIEIRNWYYLELIYN